jgi:hypothetical protein
MCFFDLPVDVPGELNVSYSIDLVKDQPCVYVGESCKDLPFYVSTFIIGE